MPEERDLRPDSFDIAPENSLGNKKSNGALDPKISKERAVSLGLGEGKVLSNSDLVSCLTHDGEVFIFAYSPELKSLTGWTSNAHSVLGVGDAAIAREGNLFLRHVHPDDRFLLLTDLEKALRGDEAYRATYRWIRPDTNEVKWLHCRASLIEREEGASFEGIILDISQEILGPLNRFAGPEAVSSIIAALPMIVLVLDSEFRILHLNQPKDDEIFGFGDPNFNKKELKIGRPLLLCFSNVGRKGQFETIFKDILDGKIEYHRARVIEGDRIYRIEFTQIAGHGRIEGLLLVITDITEVVRLERENARLHKSESLELLASGVAHNLNNALQTILGLATSITSHPERVELVSEEGEKILATVSRASKLAEKLIISQMEENDSLLPIDINLAVMVAVNKFNNLFASDIKVTASFGNPRDILAKQTRLVDAISEVLLNSKEFLGNDGKIKVITSEVFLEDNFVPGLKGGNYAKMEVSNSGPGIKKEVIESGVELKVMESGLSRAYAIVQELDGVIVVETPEEGRIVSMFFPIYAESSESQEAA